MSDWSSDVFSSDLADNQQGNPQPVRDRCNHSRGRPPFRSAEVRVNRDPAVAGMAQGVEQRAGGMGLGGGILTARKIEGEPGTPPDSRQHRIVGSGSRIGRLGAQTARNSRAPAGGGKQLREGKMG